MQRGWRNSNASCPRPIFAHYFLYSSWTNFSKLCHHRQKHDKVQDKCDNRVHDVVEYVKVAVVLKKEEVSQLETAGWYIYYHVSQNERKTMVMRSSGDLLPHIYRWCVDWLEPCALSNRRRKEEWRGRKRVRSQTVELVGTTSSNPEEDDSDIIPSSGNG